MPSSPLLPLRLPFSYVAAVTAAWAVLAFLYPASDVTGDTYLVLFLLALLAQALPIAVARERRVTFFAPVIFAATLIVGPWAAGTLAMGAYVVPALAARRSELWRGWVRASAYLIATLPVALVFLLFGQGFPFALSGDAGHPWPRVVPVLAAFCFWACIGSPAALRLRFRIHPGDVRTAVFEEAVAFVMGLPFVFVLVTIRGGHHFVQRSLLVCLVLGAAILALHAVVEVRALRKQIRAMERLGRLAIDAGDENRLLEDLLDAAHDLILFDHAFLWTSGPEDESLDLRVVRPASAAGDVPARAAFGEGPVGRLADQDQGVIGEGSALAGDSADRAIGGSLLAVPLATARRRMGVAVFTHEGRGTYRARDRERLQALANLTASGIENVRLHQSLRSLAITDGLTGLTNHRSLQEILSSEVGRSARYEHSVSVILCDVDGFKDYNDAYGHPRGDRLLQAMAHVLQNSVRATDTAARYGGEEFCIVLPETGPTQARRMAERLRVSVEATSFPGKPGEDETVRKTMSFGVASFPEDAETAEQLIALADAALYIAKKMGKNRVEVAATVREAAPPGPGETPSVRHAPHSSG